jgi:hypothetical protein
LAELPAKVAYLRQYLDDVVSVIRTAGDIEAAGAEVEDTHRDALTKITAAERRACHAPPPSRCFISPCARSSWIAVIVHETRNVRPCQIKTQAFPSSVRSG